MHKIQKPRQSTIFNKYHIDVPKKQNWNNSVDPKHFKLWKQISWEKEQYLEI